MPIVGGLDIQRKQITFDYLDTVTGDVRRGQIVSAGREHLRSWLARFAGRGDCALALEGCTGWRYVDGESAAAGVAASGHTAGHQQAAREPGYAQATGYFRKRWQVLGSNQRRLSRRFYSNPTPTHRNSR
jgi:hypothetical protein